MSRGVDRRQVLIAAGSIAGVSVSGGTGLFGAAARAQDADAERRALIRQIVWLLFPHRDLGAAPYDRVTDAILADSATAELVSAGITELETRHAGRWLELTEERQLADLESLEASPFFQYLLNTARTRLYNDREVWSFLGYGGSSMQFGGYIDHGLNDIAWLEDV